MLQVGSTVQLRVAVPIATAAVPDLVGLTGDEAAEALEGAGLGGEASDAFDAQPAGTVISQDPAPDTELPAGSTVAYVVSAGPAPVAVPDLVGLTGDEAAEALEGAGLGGEASDAFDAQPAGTVISQDPAPDTELPAGSTVAYVVSAGPAPVAVPDLVGLTGDEAAEALEGAGLGGEASDAFDAQPAGTVISQDPAPDTELPAGSTVAYVVSAGPAPVAVPDLVGLTGDEAAEALEGAGLGGEASDAFDAQPAGTVISQDPAPDTELPAGSTVAYVVSAGPAPVAVPDLVGLTGDEAAEALEGAGLGGEASDAFDAQPAGTVISQDPAPDTELPAGSTVAYVVSAGPAPVAVPDLVGLTGDEAAEALEGAGLGGEASDAFDAQPAGTVISQDPAPDTELPAGSTVAYVVSAGPAPVAVPDLVGLTGDEAAEALEEAGLGGEASDAFDAQPAGTVISQDPAPDTELPAGSTVAYVVSAGPAPVAVPDLVGLTGDEAAEALEGAGLGGEASDAFDAQPAGTVISQDPAPDTELPAGSTVAYVVSAGPAPVAVPDLVGLTGDEAAEALEGAGLGGEASDAFDAQPAGTVISQDPAPDTELPAGSTVAYVVSAGPAPVAVPDLVGLTGDEAAEALEGAGLGGEASDAFDAQPAGTVISQDPAPDTELPAGSTVAYVVSAGPAPVAVPDLVGLTGDEAAEALEGAGLGGEASDAFDAQPAGTVISQDPAPDTELPAGSTVAYVVSAGPAPVAVPDLVGLTGDEAAEALEEAGLGGEASDAFDAQPAGTVISQDPAPDTELPAGSTVAYVVSAGPAPVAVPDLVGLTGDEAAEALEAAGLGGEASDAFDAQPAGTVISQDPAPDTELPAGSTVAYVVSAGPAPVAVPDLVGLTGDEAAEALEAAGLGGEASDAFDAQPAGTVISQDPAPDTELPAGSTVAYVVSAGPAPVAVPDLVGLTGDEAAEALEGAGLGGEASDAFDAQPAGTVISQDPAPDTELPAGSTVAYVVSAGPAPVAVPDLVGLTGDEAAEALEAAGLGGEASDAFDAQPAGTVISQDPAPDTELPAGSTVAYVVSAGPAPVAVPDLVGLTGDEAAEALEGAGLGGEASDAFDAQPAGTVISQDPAPDTELPAGSTVAYVVSAGPAPVAVPDLVGLTGDEAAEALEGAGLGGEASDAFDAQPAGTVISQDPAPDTELPAGSTVAYVVSAGPAPVAVPDLVGLTGDEAAEALEGAGLGGEASDAFDAQPAGTVISQDPAPDTELPAGSTVAYVVSAGPAPVAVPDLVGLTGDEAAEALEAAGLGGEASDAFDAQPAGTVISQDPAPDTELPAGSTVAYVVSAGPAPVAVPDLVGLTGDEAAEALEGAGLGGEASDAFDAQPAGTVISQDPAPDTELPAGSTVAYVVSAGPAPVAVPDLVGLTGDEAAEALEGAGLGGEASDAFDAQPAGTVISQDPAPDTELPAGSTVAYVVSAGPAPVAVPDLVGLTGDEAAEALEGAGLGGEASDAFDAQPAGTVISQDPAPDTELPAGSTVAYVVSAGPAPVAVPDLVGLTGDEAAEALEEAGLGGEASDAFDAQPAGTVISQDPAPDTELPAGSTVAYVVSAGPAPVAVPDLVGLTGDEAAEALEGAGLGGEASDAFDAQPAGTVISQDPAPDTELPAGSTVAYVVSAGPAPVAVPDLVGLTGDEAAEALEGAGLGGEASDAFDAQPAGTVISQDPAPDTELPAGSTVAYVVSAGPAPVAVPDLVGLTGDEAAEALEGAGLGGEASDAFDAQPAGTVISQDPAPDTELPAGSTVAYVVSAGPAPVAVPDLVGLTGDEAAEALEGAGLGGEASDAFDAQPAGTVISQDPAPDTELPAGSTVAYVVSAGPAPVAVPDLVGLTGDEAAEALEAAGLGGEASDAFDAQPAGTVISQDPAPDTELPAGSTVAYVVSAGPAPVAVPDLVGLAARRGRAPRSRPPASWSGDAPRSSDAAGVDTVLAQEPAPGTEVPAGCAVDLVLSAGPAQVEVPDVARPARGRRGRPPSRPPASSSTATESRDNDDIAPGDALRTEPEAGTELAPGSAVTLVLSPGPRPWPCPTSWASAAATPATRSRPPASWRATSAAVEDAAAARHRPRPGPRARHRGAHRLRRRPRPVRRPRPGRGARGRATCPSPTRSPRSRPPVSS